MRNHNFKDVKNRVYGRLTVVGPYKYENGRGYWRCKCECGVIKSVSASSLAQGKSISCGCLNRIRIGGLTRTHGLSNSREFKIWSAMKDRCLNSRSTGYYKYGAKGITVCKAWRESFINFYQDIGPRPSLRHSIDRINNKKGYFPDNCRWATPEEQANNTTTNRIIAIDINGIRSSKTLSQWAKEYQMKPSTLHRRLALGWPILEAITLPIGTRYGPRPKKLQV